MKETFFSRPSSESMAVANRTVNIAKDASSQNQHFPLQRSMTVGSSNDPLEHEADHAAGKVMARQITSIFVNLVLVVNNKFLKFSLSLILQ